MKCPICTDVRMREVDKNGILIDICPDCKGVWLDRGELDKLMSSVREARGEYEEWSGAERDRYDRDRDNRERDDEWTRHQDHRRYPHRKKKRSVFDLFDDLFD